jgi:F0F1-type ATP synthase assembly protein I
MASDREKQPGDEEAPPGVPHVPDLPEAPRLEPHLPPIPKERADEGDYRRAGLAYTIPAALVAPILVLTLGGAWLDERLHRSPAFTLAGAVLGFVVGMINMVRIAGKLNR